MTARPTKASAGTDADKVRVGVCDKIKSLLREQEKTYQHLAFGLGVSLVSITRTLNGHQWFSFEHLVATARFLKVPLSTLFEDVERRGEVVEGDKSSPQEWRDFGFDSEYFRAFLDKHNKTDQEVFDWLGSQITNVERAIIILRRFKRPLATLQEVSILFGISRQRVAQLEKKAFKKLK